MSPLEQIQALRGHAIQAVDAARALERRTGDPRDMWLVVSASKFLADIETREVTIAEEEAKRGRR